jgi:hypothetical protein
MNHSQFEGIWDRLHAGFPRDFHSEDTRQLWAGFMASHDSTTVMGSVNNWIASNRRAPAIADVLEGVRASKRSIDTVVEHYCGQCSNGWVWVHIEGQGTVAHCPNGCRPPMASTHVPAQVGEKHGPQVFALARAFLTEGRDRRSEIGAIEYLTERGYDSSEYRIVDGVIMANPPDPRKRITERMAR